VTYKFITLSSDPSVVDEEARWYPLQDNPMLQAFFNRHGSGMSLCWFSFSETVTSVRLFQWSWHKGIHKAAF